jgi:hypothetical protein
LHEPGTAEAPEMALIPSVDRADCIKVGAEVP